METADTKPFGGIFKQLVVIFLIVVSIYLAEGARGLQPFLNLEALLLVFGGTLFLTWTAYPLREFFKPSGPAVYSCAAGCAMAMGTLATVLGMILMLVSIHDVAQMPRRMALSFSSLFFGILLSEVIFAPLAARLTVAARSEDKPSAQPGNGKRVFLALLGLGAALFCMMVTLYALSAAVPHSRDYGVQITAKDALNH